MTFSTWQRRSVMSIGLAAALVAALLLSVCGPRKVRLTAEEHEWLAAHGPLRFAPDPAFPPIESFDETGAYRGLVADYFQLIERRLGTPIEIVHFKTWEEVLAAAQDGRIDGITAAQQTAERSAYLDFTSPIIDLPNVIVVRSDERGTASFSTLAGRRLAVTAGYALEEHVRAQFPRVVLVPMPDDLAALSAVSFGQADAAVVNLAIASWLIETHGITNLRVAGDSRKGNALRIATRRDEPLLLGVMEKGLAAVSRQERAEIGQAWIHLDDEARRSATGFLVLLLVTGSAVGLSALVFSLWNASLRRRVAQATVSLQQELAERLRAEARLRDSQRQLATHLQQSLFFVIEWDLDFRVREWNPAAERIFGFSRAEAVGRPAVELIVPPAARSHVDAVWRQLKSTSGGQFSFNQNVTKDGRTLECEWFNTVIGGESGQPTGVVSLGVDVTARVSAEREAKAERERLEVTLRSIADAVISTDREGRVVDLNAAGARLTGRELENARGQWLADVLPLRTPEGGPAPDPVAAALAHPGPGLPGEGTLELRAGERRTIAYTAAAISDGSGAAVGAVLVCRDVTERRQREQLLSRTQRLESLAVLAGGIAHDFNNLLTGITANVSLAMTGDVPPGELAELLRETETAAFRARGLTQQLLTFSRGGAPTRRVDQLEPVVREAAQFASRGSSGSVQVTVAPGLWPASVDAGQLGQVVQNLVINALEAMAGGGRVDLELSNVEAKDSPLVPRGAAVRLRVSDRGPGIPRELQTRIFDPFFSTKQRGSGLGLAVCHSVVTKHGGVISVQSAPESGPGTCIEVVLPATPEGARAAAAPVASTYRSSARVLVMDDEPLLQRAAARAFGSLGCAVETVADGSAAVRSFSAAKDRGQPFDVVVLDLTVPGGMGGAETLTQLLVLDPKLRAIVSSGYSTAGAAAEQGFAAILPKPYSIDQVRSALETALGGR